MGTLFHWQGDWKRWFAWRPVRLESGEIAWLRYVERRPVNYAVPEIGVSHNTSEYRAV